MRRGKTTRGRVARTMVGAEAAEFKATIPTKQVKAAMRLLGLVPKNDARRYVYFFDTPGLDLLASGIIARARRVPGGDHDSTVKFRPVDPAKLPARWKRFAGFKVEADASEKGVTVSASLGMPVKRGRIKDVAAGKQAVKSLFDEDQEAFLLSLARRRIDYAKVVVLGPITAWRWKLDLPALPWPLTAELWRRPDGHTLLEVSIKAPVVQAAVAAGGFMAYLAEVGAERDMGQETKTRWALSYFASQVRVAGRRPRKARPRTHAGTVAPKRRRPPPTPRVRRSKHGSPTPLATTGPSDAPAARPAAAPVTLGAGEGGMGTMPRSTLNESPS